MTKHRHVLDLVDDYLHDLLTSGQAQHVHDHTEVCPICRVALEEAHKRHAALHAVPAAEATQDLVHKTIRRVEDHHQRMRRLRWWGTRVLLGTAAAAALLIGAMHLHYYNLAPLPYDLQVLGQSELLADSNAALRVRLVNHNTGQPIAGVPVDLQLRGQTGQFVQLASFTTGAQGTGTPRFRLPDWADGDYELRVTARTSTTWERVAHTVRLKRSWKLMLTSDKPVYQPGQTIKLRSLALRRPDQKPVAGHEVTFSITDPKGNVIFKRRDVTGNYGIASAQCPLATEITEGTYTIRCEAGDTRSQRSVDVAKYVLPKFGIEVALDRAFYEPGAKLNGTVQADYFFGKPVAGGKVEVKVYATDVGEQEIATLERTTDVTGKAAFDVALPDALVGSERHSGDAQVSLVVKVTDSAGQEQSRMVSRFVTTQPLRVEVIPESGALVRGLPNTIYFFASYADGRPAKARLAISGIEEEIQTSALGVASVELIPRDDEVGLTIRATDGDGLVGRRHVRLQCGTANGDFLLRTDKAVYDGGQTVQLVALGSGTEPVFVDFIKDGQTILTAAIPIDQGRGQYEFDLPPDLSGTIQLLAYRFQSPHSPPSQGGARGGRAERGRAAAVAIRKTRILYVRPAQHLHIDATVDRNEYRPGGTAKLTVSLTGADGKPTPGAVSLAAVDVAVYSVLQQRPGMEQTFFALEQELLEPVYAIYPWSPDFAEAQPQPERDEFNLALFTRTNATVKPANVRSADSAEFRPHSLSLASYPAKELHYQATRQSGLAGVTTAWVLLLSAVGVSFYVILLFAFPRTLFAISLLIVLVGLPLLFLVNVGGSAIPFIYPDTQLSEFSTEGPAAGAMRFRGGAASETDTASIAQQTVAPPRIRQWFPETLLWRPELITDSNGKATLDVNLADSITTWRLSCSAVSAGGQLGGSEAAIRVFQPFFVDLNLPVALTRGDEVAVPVVVYNYLDRPQTVQLTLDDAQWFQRIDAADRRIELAAGEVRSTSYRLRVTKVGKWELTVTAKGSASSTSPASGRSRASLREVVADAIKRQIEVVPDGRPVEVVYNGTLQQPADITLKVPDNAVEGSAKAIVKIYPSSFSQLVEGLDAVFQRPYGCFEQTSSTTYPNILALDYLRRTGKSVPDVEAKARQYIHLGYQRLLGFEVPGGGFDWFGNPPGKRTLTAYGLMDFEDMARVHDVDPNLIERTRRWLLDQRAADGTWDPSEMLHDDPTRSGDARLTTTAYIAWAVFAGGNARSDTHVTTDFLLSHEPAAIASPYVVALLANSLSAVTSSSATAKPYLDRLEAMKKNSADGKLVWWEQIAGDRTAFYGSGRSGSIETTALATLAMIEAGAYPATARGALAWLIEQKDAAGTWHSTQATVLALKALLAGTGKPLGGDAQRRIALSFDDSALPELVIPADQADVMQQIDLSDRIGTGPHRLALRDMSETGAGYSVAFGYHVPDAASEQKADEPLSIAIDYDRSELPVGQTVDATATVVNHLPAAAPMVLLDLPVPPGFAVDRSDFDALVQSQHIAKYQLTPRSTIVYLRSLEPAKPFQLRYRLRATMPVNVQVPPARAYHYYDPDKRAASRPGRLVVTGGA